MLSVLLFPLPLARAQVVPTTTTPPPSSLSDQSTSSDTRYWTDRRVSEVFLFIAFFLGCFFFAYLFYAYAIKRRRRAAAASHQWNGAYGPGGYGNAHSHAFTQDRSPYSQSGYAALGTQPGCEQYPPPPLYAQAMYAPEPHVHIPKQHVASARAPPLSRAASSASTSTLVGYSKDNKGNGRRLSEDDEDNAPVLETQLARPQPAKQSSWRGRFARLGDRA